MRIQLVLPLLLLTASMLGARPLAAEETTPAPTPDAADAEPAFVDRDGDGLQDGQEHRFRGRWKTQGGQGRGCGGEGAMGRHGAGGTGERGGERRQRGAP